MKLTEDERDILDSVERGEWTSIPDCEREAERYRLSAQATLQNQARARRRWLAIRANQKRGRECNSKTSS